MPMVREIRRGSAVPSAHTYLLASAAVGAVAGGGIGKFAGHRVEQDIHGHSDG